MRSKSGRGCPVPGGQCAAGQSLHRGPSPVPTRPARVNISVDTNKAVPPTSDDRSQDIRSRGALALEKRAPQDAGFHGWFRTPGDEWTGILDTECLAAAMPRRLAHQVHGPDTNRQGNTGPRGVADSDPDSRAPGPREQAGRLMLDQRPTERPCPVGRGCSPLVVRRLEYAKSKMPAIQQRLVSRRLR